MPVDKRGCGSNRCLTALGGGGGGGGGGGRGREGGKCVCVCVCVMRLTIIGEAETNKEFGFTEQSMEKEGERENGGELYTDRHVPFELTAG